VTLHRVGWGLLPAVLLLTAIPAFAHTLTLEGAMEQGGLIRGKAEPGARVTLDGRALRVAPDGAFIFGFFRNAPAHATLVVTYRDGAKTHRDLAVTAQHYEIQRIEGLPENQVSPNPETLTRILHDIAAIKAAHKVNSSNLDFETPFIWPVLGPISGVFGSQRILDGQPRAPHAGTDIAAPAGTPVKAPAGGTVTLAEPDFVLDGGTVVIDHGYGLSTLYIHLSRIAVHKGEAVTPGQVIGAVGATGRATGANLHWGVYWYEMALDPMLAAGPMPPH
jgi:murein DD-endopeptidase MepM/ murein hydrolase activator NlpD